MKYSISAVHVCLSPGQIFLQDPYRTATASGWVHFLVESAARDKFVFAGAGFTSTFRTL